jgi:serine protease Do
MSRWVYGSQTRTWFLSLLLVALASGGVVYSATRAGAADSAAPAAASSSEATNFARSLSKAFRGAADLALPAVVAIVTRPDVDEKEELLPDSSGENSGDPLGELFKRDPNLRRFFGDMPSPLQGQRTPRRAVASIGSGVIIDASGVILTNNHVVANAGKIVVRLMDGREFTATEVKNDPRTDLAILRIKNAGSLKAARLGDSDKLAVGDWVLALGDPFGLEGTVTAGIISAKGRAMGIRPRESFLQTDAAINPGNSGGPLVNLDGEVVGINTAISSGTGVNAGIGFAVPINLAKWVGNQLVKTGRVQRAYLGIGIQPLTQSLADEFNVKVHEGVIVGNVGENSPAAKAGVKDGDVIVKFNGQAVSSPSELQGIVEQATIGQNYPMEIVREGKRTTIQVAPLEQPANYGMARMEKQESSDRSEATRFEKLGVEVTPLTDELAEQVGVKPKSGVVISRVAPNSPAGMAGLQPGMVITQAAHKPVTSVEEFKKIVESQPLDKGLFLQLRSKDGAQFVVIQLRK